MRSEFDFIYVDIYFDGTKCKSSLKNFVSYTKIIFFYDFVAPLNKY